MSDPCYEFYSFKDLVAAGIVRHRYDLWFKIHHRGFPKPLKHTPSVQGAATYRKSAVHAWLDLNHPQDTAKPADAGVRPSARKSRKQSSGSEQTAGN